MSDQPTTTARAGTPSVGRVVVAVFLGLVYGFVAFLILTAVSFFVRASSSGGEGDLKMKAVTFAVNAAGFVFPVLFVGWQERREFKRSVRLAAQG